MQPESEPRKPAELTESLADIGYCVVCGNEYIISYIYLEDVGQYTKQRRTAGAPCDHREEAEE